MTAPANAFAPPLVLTLPVSLGQDLIVTLRNMVPGSNPVTYQDFPDGVTVTMILSKYSNTEPTNVIAAAPATISGSNAVCRIASVVMDTIKSGTLWRIEVAIPDPDGVHIDHVVPVNGTLERHDGSV